ncbi:MAG: VTT domain-containing protein [Bradymonadaceae bacterium]|nr:VTT domain-containing protein [Lujinxingiaceae bacterium]
MEEYFQSLIEQYGYLVVFLASAVGHAGIPRALVLAVAIAATFGLNPFLIFMACIAGSLLADFGYYSLGRYIGQQLLSMLHKHFPRLEGYSLTASRLIEKNTARFIIFGRFTPFVGRFVPLAGGLVSLNFPLFTLYSFCGAILVALSYGSLAFFLGTIVVEQLQSPLIALLVLVMLLTLSFFIYWLVLRFKRIRGQAVKHRYRGCQTRPRRSSAPP